VGQPIYDTATLSGGDSPGGWITWNLYKANTGCVKTVDPVSVPVDGDGTYTTPPITPAWAGTYQWVASYSGDANNNAIASSCNDINEQSVLSPASPSISTTASSNTLGQPIDDTATLSGGDSPTGALRWSLYQAGTGCVTPLFTSGPVSVDGDGTYSSPSFTPASAGTYQWVASYSGDTNNVALSSACNVAAEQSVVNAPTTTPPTSSGSPTPPAPSGAPTATVQTVKAVKVLRCARGKVKKHKKVHGKTVTVCVKKRVRAAVHRRVPAPSFTG
jgi:hypothetical protein